MAITVTIPGELANQARARSFMLETLVRDLMTQKFSQEQADKSQRRRAVDAMLQFAQKHGLTLGSDDLKSTVHEGHKY